MGEQGGIPEEEEPDETPLSGSHDYTPPALTNIDQGKSRNKNKHICSIETQFITSCNDNENIIVSSVFSC